MTPLQLEIMGCAYTGEPRLNQHFQRLACWQEQADDLFNNGMIEQSEDDGRCKYHLTEKGRFWFQRVLDMKYPKIQYVME